MKIAPAKRNEALGCPVQDKLKVHPEFRYAPKWLANTLMAISALFLVCLILAARNGLTEEKKINPSRQNKPAAVNVAPIFRHGVGISRRSLVFLTEDEARQIINEEAAKFGIHFEKDKNAIDCVELPITNNQYGLDRDLRTSKPKTRTSSLILDGTDATKNISYEFVSMQDILDWRIEIDAEGDIEESIDKSMHPEKYQIIELGIHEYEYDIKPVVELMQKNLVKAHPNQKTAVFYDPLSESYDFFTTSDREIEKKEKSSFELRKQVRDFITWLRAQGII
jgi:hypothetical protein